MATIKKFEEIISWKEARELNKTVGKLIDDKRFSQNFRLINQIEGSAGSIMDNIAEGFERGGNKEFIQFLSISKGSCGELRSQLYRALDRNYITQTEFDAISLHAMKISSLIQKLINYLESSSLKGNKYKDRDKEIEKTS
jgi:four helix bundle protein